MALTMLILADLRTQIVSGCHVYQVLCSFVKGMCGDVLYQF